MAALGVLALPAGATAHSRPSVATVAAHVRATDVALHRERALVPRGHHRAVDLAFLASRREIRAAGSEARRLRRHRMSFTSQARVLRLLATVDNNGAETNAALLDEVSGRLQEQTAAAVGSDLRDREATLTMLASLVPHLSGDDVAVAGAALGALSSDGKDEIASLTAALESGHLPPAVLALAQRALSSASHAVDDGLVRLRDLISTLPTDQQAPVREGLDEIARTLPQVAALLGSLLGGDAGSGSPANVDPQTLIDVLNVPGGFQLPSWLFG